VTFSFFCRLTADLTLYFSFANYLFLFFAPKPDSLSAAPFLFAPLTLGPLAALLAAGLLSYLIKIRAGQARPGAGATEAEASQANTGAGQAKAGAAKAGPAPRLLQALPLLLPCLILAASSQRFPASLSALAVLVTLPPWAYLVYLLYHDREQLSYNQYHDRFIRSLKLLPLLLLPPLFSLRPELLALAQTQILPFVILHLFCGVLSLRLSRHQRQALGRKAMNLINLLLLLCFFLLCLSFVYSHLWLLAWQGLALLYRHVLLPLLLLLAAAIALPFFAFGLLLKLLTEKRPPGQGFPLTAVLDESIEAAVSETPLAVFPEPLRYALLSLLLLVLLWAAWRLFRQLAARPSGKAASPAVSESRQRLSPDAGQDLELLPPRDPRAAVRYYYRKFLRLCQKQGLMPDTSHTSLDIQVMAKKLLPSQEAAITELRRLYLPARYDESGNATDKEKAGQARAMYRLIKKAFAEQANER
jgi:hypothetical protein